LVSNEQVYVIKVAAIIAVIFVNLTFVSYWFYAIPILQSYNKNGFFP